ncbi:MAG: hypothetical protein GTO16_10485 [Candidatus Aminicenantes bacterium]|nr:hypothetical protein [Candidatus Aminicenantes bacterium]
MTKKRKFLAVIGVLWFFTLVFIFELKSFAADSSPRHLFLCLDSIPYSIFIEAQERGLFKDYRSPSKVIAPFPALSNYAWAVIMNTGKLESYQAKHYNFGLNKIVGRLIREVGKPTYPNRFDFSDDRVIKKIIAYIITGGSVKGEMKGLARAVLSSNQPQLFFALIGTSDIVAHMKGAKGLHKVLKTVDRELARIREEHLKKFKEPLVVTIVSDHGNTLKSGKIIKIKKVLKENNFNLAKKLKGPNDVIYYTSGILSVANFFIQDARKIELAHTLATQPWTDVVVTYDREKEVFLVISQKGTLAFQYSEEKNEFRIRSLVGEDPLGLVPHLPLGRWIPQSQVLEASVETRYPDSLMRIQTGLSHRRVNHPASVIVSLKKGWESGNRFIKFLAKLRGRFGTHGALAALESVGVISSTDYEFPEWIPARGVHKLIEGYDFGKRFEAMTLIWTGNGNCKARFGQPLLDLPDIDSVQFIIQVFDQQRSRFSRSYDLYSMKLPSRYVQASSLGNARFFDVLLPKTPAQGILFQLQARALDVRGRVVAKLKTKRITIKRHRGYSKVPIKKIFVPPKKHLAWY